MLKKRFVVLYAVLGGLALGACTLPIPTGVEIRANPRMKLPAAINFSEKFSEGIKSGFSGDNMKIYDCINVEKPDPQTFLISIKLIELDNPLDGTGLSGGVSVPAGGSVPLTDNSSQPIPIPLSDLSKFMGDGLEFTDIKSKLYVSDSNNTGLVDILKIKLETATTPIADISNIVSGPSNLAVDQPDYTATDLPPGGNIIDIASVLNSKQEENLIYDISLKGGTTIPAGAASAVIKLELLIWLPLKFKASDPSGAFLHFPDMFEDGKDLFGRTSEEESMLNMMSRIRVEIGMNDGAFNGGQLEIDFRDGEKNGVKCPLSNNAIVVDLGSDDIAYINTHYPFSPNIGIWFAQDTGPTISRGMGVISLEFDADINYRL